MRFLYIRPLDRYLTLTRERDVIELPIEDDLDINGWDIAKALTLLGKANPVLFEWLASPIRYRADEEPVRMVQAFAGRVAHRTAATHHDRSLAAGNLRRHIDGQDRVRLKKYFYGIRNLHVRTISGSGPWLSAHPPLEWNVELARWLDERFSFARPSRRQAGTPDIPRPSRRPAFGTVEDRTFGVLLDSSGSMDRVLLGKALGAIASYATAKDVRHVRVVFCDAATYDQCYVDVLEIVGRLTVRGRGGTVLQPGIDLLEDAEDFPRDAPLLVITDGYCDTMSIRRDHALPIPAGGHLSIVPRGPVFRVR